MALGPGLGVVLPELQLLEHLGGGATAVVAHAREPEGPIQARAGLPLEPVALHRHRVAAGADRRRGQGEHLRSAAAAPAEEAMGEGVGGVPGQLVGAEPVHAGGPGHRGQAGAKAEAVGQPAELVLPFRERGAAVGLAQLELAQQRGRGDQHAIAFDPGTIDRLPAARGHGLADAGEQGRPVLGDPGVQSRGGVAEMELGMALHQAQHRLEGALRRPPGVRHRPEPGQIEMGVAQELKTALARPLLGLEGLKGRAETAWPIGRLGIGASQGRLQRSRRRLVAPGRPQGHQFQGRACQQPLGIGAIGGLQLQPALDQGAVVVAGAAQRKAEVEGFAPPPGLRQHPAAGGIKQVTAMDRLASD